MKTTFIKLGLNNYPFGTSRTFDVKNDELNPLTLKDFSSPTPMIEQQIAPPAHVWDKIVQVLDLQDKEKQSNQPSASIKIQKKNGILVSGLMLSMAVVIYWVFN